MEPWMLSTMPSWRLLCGHFNLLTTSFWELGCCLLYLLISPHLKVLDNIFRYHLILALVCPRIGHLRLFDDILWNFGHHLAPPLLCLRIGHLRLFDNILWTFGHHLALPFLCLRIGHLRLSDDIWTVKLASRNAVLFFQSWSSLGHLVALLTHFRLWVSVTQVFLASFYRLWLEIMLLCMQPCSFWFKSWGFMSTWLALCKWCGGHLMEKKLDFCFGQAFL